jgi:AraC-like DNA-binding protein
MSTKSHKIASYGLDSVDKHDFFTIKSMEEMAHTSQMLSDLPHRHDYYMAMWVKKGAGKHFIDFKMYPLGTNCIFLLSPWQVHYIELFAKPDGVVLLFTQDLLFRCGISTDFMTDLNLFSDVDENPPIVIPSQSTSKFQGVVDKIYHEMEQDDVLKWDVIGTYLKIFLIECQRIRNMDWESSHQSVPTNHLLTKKFKELVDQHYKELHQVKYYAEKMNITSNHLNTVIGKTIGTNAKKFILNRIMLEAKRMVYYTDLSLKEMAFELGFNDPAYFSKLFHKQNGNSFNEFKKQANRNNYRK